MTESRRDFHLSAEEVDYLSQLAEDDKSLAKLLQSQECIYGHLAILSLSRAEAEGLRDFLTTKLAAVGFDESYSPNKHGQMLERLIDKFYLC